MQNEPKEKGIMGRENQKTPRSNASLQIKGRHIALRSLDIERLPHVQVSDSAHPAKVCSHGLVERASRTCHCWTFEREAAPQDALHSMKLLCRVPAIDEGGRRCKKIHLAPQSRGLSQERSSHSLHQQELDVGYRSSQ
jgi:hypothetical protein